MTRTKADQADKLVCRFVSAACIVTNDDPLRDTSIQSVADHLHWDDWELIDRVVQAAAAKG